MEENSVCLKSEDIKAIVWLRFKFLQRLKMDSYFKFSYLEDDFKHGEEISEKNDRVFYLYSNLMGFMPVDLIHIILLYCFKIE